MILEGGYVEFKDVAKITGLNRTLDYLGKSYNVIKECLKTLFPHKFATLDNISRQLFLVSYYELTT